MYTADCGILIVYTLKFNLFICNQTSLTGFYFSLSALKSDLKSFVSGIHMYACAHKHTYQLGFEKLEKGALKNSLYLEILEYCSMTWGHRHSKLWTCSKSVRGEKGSFCDLSYIYLCSYLLHLCVHICVCTQAGHSAHMWMSENKFRSQSLSSTLWVVGIKSVLLSWWQVYLTAESCQWHERKSAKTKCKETVSNILKWELFSRWLIAKCGTSPESNK